jgi:hypothetical protein
MLDRERAVGARVGGADELIRRMRPRRETERAGALQ